MSLPAFPVNTDLRTHLKLSLVVALWLIVFLVLIAPFDTADLSWQLRLLLLPPYGLLFILAYLPAVLVQNGLYRRLGYWNLPLEALILLLAYGLSLVLSYAYYKTEIIRGTFSFGQFVGTVYLPTLLVMSFLLIFGRWFISREAVAKEAAAAPLLLSLRGANWQDVLRLRPEQLVCIRGAQNYVEVHYLEEEELKKQLLRTTLTKLSKQVPDLLRVHRSYLVNPAHFVRWEGTAKAIFPGQEVPVAKQYREKLAAALAEG